MSASLRADLRAVKRVLERCAAGWHDLSQEEYEEAVEAFDRLHPEQWLMAVTAPQRPDPDPQEVTQEMVDAYYEDDARQGGPL